MVEIKEEDINEVDIRAIVSVVAIKDVLEMVISKRREEHVTLAMKRDTFREIVPIAPNTQKLRGRCKGEFADRSIIYP